MQQTTDTLLLVRPFSFRKNEQTAVNNYFQEDLAENNLDALAKAEFDHFVTILNAAKVNTLILQDNGEWDTPDSIFPNNCFSTHQGTAVKYPMFAVNRQLEHQLDHIGFLQSQGFAIDRIVDYREYAKDNRFLEGTGCLILDRVHRIAYCSLSDRADEKLIHLFCKDMDYQACIFQAKQTVGQERLPIYHSNVMLSVGTHFAVVCLSSIDDTDERNRLVQQLESTGKTIIAISAAQMNGFAGNILEVSSSEGKPLIVMSSTAYNSFTADQRILLESFGELIHAPLDSIETCGGGSARCMLAEVFYA